MAEQASQASTALAGCRIDRALGGRVELVEASAQNRSFPERVTQSLGLCLKFGAAHEVSAAGRRLRYPADALCIRMPGCVWSTAVTGPVAFLSIDVEAELLPADLRGGSMHFASGGLLPELRSVCDRLRRSTSPLHEESLVAELVERAQGLGLITARSIARTTSERRLCAAREVLEDRIESAPSLSELAALVQLNKFALIRQFRARYGVPPHAFSVLVRVERAKGLLARGVAASEVAQRLGFCDQAHFGRSFKRVVGLSPVAYARSVRRVVCFSR